MASVFHYPAILQDDHPVRDLRKPQPVGDDDADPSLTSPPLPHPPEIQFLLHQVRFLFSCSLSLLKLPSPGRPNRIRGGPALQNPDV